MEFIFFVIFVAEFLSIPSATRGILSQVIFLSGGIQMPGISEQVSVGFWCTEGGKMQMDVL